jgi:sugar/nucleoside kinase (ribokinase family)
LPPNVLVVGSLAYDDVQTPFDSRREVLGGAASYFAMAASLYAPVRMVGVVGDDFAERDLARFRGRPIDTTGIERLPGRSFHWLGRYDYAMNAAETINTDLGVFAGWRPTIPPGFADSELVFLANIHPAIQLRTLEQIQRPRLVVLDTMNYWIEKEGDALRRVIRRVDVFSVNEAEIRELAAERNVYRAAKAVMDLGPRAVVVKRAEYGAMLFTRDRGFWVPAYPVEDVRDPTGAGDAFAGGFIGDLTRCPELDDRALRRAMLHGTVCASFAVEDFSVDGIERATAAGIAARVGELEALVAP